VNTKGCSAPLLRSVSPGKTLVRKGVVTASLPWLTIRKLTVARRGFPFCSGVAATESDSMRKSTGWRMSLSNSAA